MSSRNVANERTPRARLRARRRGHKPVRPMDPLTRRIGVHVNTRTIAILALVIAVVLLIIFLF